MRYILISAAALLLAACGTKGPLTLPPPGTAKPAVQSAPVKADDNKARAPAAADASSPANTSQK